MRNTLRSWLAAASLAGLAWLSGCGGGGNDPATPPPLPPPATVGPPVVDSARASSASIGPEGGTLRATAADGTEYTLTVPAGALTETVTIRMTPIVDINNPVLANGLTGAVQFEPSGLRFQRVATLHIGAAGVLPAGSRRVGFSSASDGSRVQLSPPVVSNGGTEIPVSHFSSAGAANLTPGQIAQLPPAEPVDLSDPNFALDQIMRLVDITAASSAPIFTSWLDQYVNLEIAKASVDPGSIFDAEKAYGIWVDAVTRVAVLFGDEVKSGGELRALLAPAQEQTKTALARKFLPFIDNSLAVCQIVIDVSNASAIQRRAAAYGIDTVEFGLDRPSFLRKVNDCLRPVLDPITLPSTLSPGQPVSLDARAQVVFNGQPNPVGAGFEFTITATDATVATPVGLSDGDGRYTTVFTPSTAAPIFDVRACLALNDGSPLGSDICVTQVLNQPGSRVFAGTITSVLSVLFPPAVFTTTATVRVRISDDGFTGEVLSATGTFVSEAVTRLALCTDPITGVFTNIDLHESATGTVTAARYRVSGSTGVNLNFAGSRTTTTEVDQDPGPACRISTQVVTVAPPQVASVGTASNGALVFEGGRLASINFTADVNVGGFRTVGQGVLLPEN